jgi:hypothetical protein
MGMMDMHKDSTREVGMFDLPIYGASQLKGKTADQIADIKLKEIRNGRLAMLGKHMFTYTQSYHILLIVIIVQLLEVLFIKPLLKELKRLANSILLTRFHSKYHYVI